MENWEKEFEEHWEETRNGTQVDYQDIKDFISAQKLGANLINNLK